VPGSSCLPVPSKMPTIQAEARLESAQNFSFAELPLE
jgi:hypothetical protein